MLTYEQFRAKAQEIFKWGKHIPNQLEDRALQRVFKELGFNRFEKTSLHRKVTKVGFENYIFFSILCSKF